MAVGQGDHANHARAESRLKVLGNLILLSRYEFIPNLCLCQHRDNPIYKHELEFIYESPWLGLLTLRLHYGIKWGFVRSKTSRL